MQTAESFEDPWKKPTQVINHSAVPSVTTSAQSKDIWRLMQESTHSINHSAVPSVTTKAPEQVIWKNMKEFTLVRNLSSALSVTSNVLTQVQWSNMKEAIQVWNYSAVPTMTTNVQDPVIWRIMKEFTLVISHKLVTSVLRLRSCRVTRGYLPGNRRRYRSGTGQVRSITWSLPATWLENHAFSHFLLVWLWNEAVYNVLPLQCPPHYWKLLLEIIQFPF